MFAYTRVSVQADLLAILLCSSSVSQDLVRCGVMLPVLSHAPTNTMNLVLQLAKPQLAACPRPQCCDLASVLVHRFVLHLPENLPMNAAAPLLCAGITTYSPLMHYGLNKPGMKIGVVGLGGLGHMAVKIAKAMGVEVSCWSMTSGEACLTSSACLIRHLSCHFKSRPACA